MSNATAERWAAPAVHGPTIGVRRESRKEARQEREAYEQAYAKGEAEGQAAGQARFDALNAQLAQRLQRLDATLSVLAKPLAELDECVERQLVQLALAAGRQLARRELRIDPEQMLAIVRETAALLPAAARDVRIIVGPEDAEILRIGQEQSRIERAWTVVEDASVARGGCRIAAADGAHIDARWETRMSEMIEQVLGEER